jgi:hypothetical protein
VLAHFYTEHQRRTRLVACLSTSNSESVSSRLRVNSRQITEFPFSNGEPPRMCGFHIEPLISSVQNLIGVPETLRVLRRLIGTPERLETRVSHRKQTTGCCSNRYSSRHTNVSPAIAHRSTERRPTARIVSRSSFSGASVLRHLRSSSVHFEHPPSSRELLELTRHSKTSRIAPKLLKTKDRAPLYPAHFSTRRTRLSGAEPFSELRIVLLGIWLRRRRRDGIDLGLAAAGHGVAVILVADVFVDGPIRIARHRSRGGVGPR